MFGDRPRVFQPGIRKDGARGWLGEIVDGALTRAFASAFRKRRLYQTAERADA
jgi:hypothetical protein